MAVCISARSALATPLADASLQPSSGVLHDAPTCLPATDRQTFADEVRKAQIRRVRDPTGAMPMVIFADGHADAGLLPASAARERLTDSHRWRVPSDADDVAPNPLVRAVATHLLVQHVRGPTADLAASTLRDAFPAANVVELRVAAATSAEMVHMITQHARAAAQSVPTVLVFSDAVSCYRQKEHVRHHTAASAALSWAFHLATRVANRNLRVVVSALPALLLHDEVYSHMLDVAGSDAIEFVQDADGVLDGLAQRVFEGGEVTIPSVSSGTDGLIDAVADQLAELHTTLAMEGDDDSDDDDDAASTARAMAVLVVIVPNVASAHVIRNAAEARYVTEPMRCVHWTGFASSPTEDAGDLPVATATSTPLIVIATYDDITISDESGLRAFVSHFAAGRSVCLKSVVHCGLDASYQTLSIHQVHSSAVQAATALATAQQQVALYTATVARIHGVEKVAVTVGERIWEMPKLTVRFDRRRHEYSSTEECVEFGFGSCLAPNVLDYRHVVQAAEACIAVSQAASAWIGAAGETAGCRLVIDWPTVVLVDVVRPIPALTPSSGGALQSLASLTMRLLTLSESAVQCSEDSQQPQYVASCLGQLTSRVAGLLSTRALLFAVSCRAGSITSVLTVCHHLASDRALFETGSHWTRAHVDATRPGVGLSFPPIAALKKASWFTAFSRELHSSRLSHLLEGVDESVAATPKEVDRLLAHPALLMAAYPCVDAGSNFDGDDTHRVTSAIARVLHSDVSHPRYQLALAATRSRRTHAPVTQRLTGTCRGWTPAAPLTLKLQTKVQVLTLDENDNPHAKPSRQQTVEIEMSDDVRTTSSDPTSHYSAGGTCVSSHGRYDRRRLRRLARRVLLLGIGMSRARKHSANGCFCVPSPREGPFSHFYLQRHYSARQ
jgi:hypothetical protein